MSFRRDRELRRQRRRTVATILLAVGLLVFLVAAGARPVVSTGYRISAPVWRITHQVAMRVSDAATLATRSKKSLIALIQELEERRQIDRVDLLRAELLEQENQELREALGVQPSDENWVVAGVLVRPPHTPYDILVLDVGDRDGVEHGQLVFTGSGVVIGSIQQVLEKQSFVTLFSTPLVQTDVVLAGQGVAVTARGRGGGVYEIHLPRDITVEPGQQVVLPGRATEVLGVIQEVVFDPRDPFQTVYVSAPVNLYHQRLVYVSERRTVDVPVVDTVVVDMPPSEEANQEASTSTQITPE